MDELIDLHHPLWGQVGIPLLILINALWLGVVAEKLIERVRRGWKLSEGVDALLHGLSSPLKWLIWGSSLLIVAYLTFKQADLELPYLLEVGRLFLLGIVFWTAFRWKSTFERHLMRRYESTSKEKLSLTTAVSRLLSIFLVVIGILIFLDILHIPIGALLAFGGVGGLAVGLAAQGLIANLFGGLMIHINRHFAIGDWIYSPNKQFEGIVEEIGWYQTRIRTLERRPTFIPNSLLTDAIIENPGRMYNRRIRAKISLTYDDVNKVDAITKALEDMLRGHEEIDQRQQLLVNLVELADSSLDLELYCFTKTTTLKGFRTALQDILLKVTEIVAKHGAHMAYPTSTIYSHILDEKRPK